MRIPHKIFKIGLYLAPIFYLKDQGKKTTLYNVDNSTHFKVRVNSYDKQAIYEVWKLKEYTNECFKINLKDIVIDIGAHIGAFALFAARKASQGRVYAYEPFEENFRLLEENKKSNGINNISPFNLAVTGKNGEGVLFVSGIHNMSSSLYEKEFKKKQSVKTTSLSEILDKNKLQKVNFLKIDAEGAEYEIILKTPPSVLRKIDKIVIEYHDYLNLKHSHQDLAQYLQRNGFKVSLGMNFIIRKILKMGLIKAKRIKNNP